jgi:hypothetical protein
MTGAELGHLLKTLISFVRTAAGLKELVEGQMYRIITELGDVQYNAACSALRDMTRSGRPSREVESAITCLRSAYEAYDSQSTTSVMTYGWAFAGYGPEEHKKACEAACLISVCYAYLREKELTLKYLNLSKKHFDKYESEILEIEEKRRKNTISLGTFIEGKILEWRFPMAQVRARVRDEKTKHNEFVEVTQNRISKRKLTR